MAVSKTNLYLVLASISTVCVSPGSARSSILISPFEFGVGLAVGKEISLWVNSKLEESRVSKSSRKLEISTNNRAMSLLYTVFRSGSFIPSESTATYTGSFVAYSGGCPCTQATAARCSVRLFCRTHFSDSPATGKQALVCKCCEFQ